MVRIIKQYSPGMLKVATLVMIGVMSTLMLYQIDFIVPDIDLSPGIRIPRLVNVHESDSSTESLAKMNTQVEDTKNSIEFNQDKIKLRFMDRKEKLKRVCSAHHELVNRENIYYTTKRMLYNEEHNLISCFIAKVGSTTWRYLFLKFIDANADNSVRSKKNKMLTQLRDLKSGEESIRLLSLNNVYKILTVRHPLDRILSLYRNKFKEGNITLLQTWNSSKRTVNKNNADFTLEDVLKYMLNRRKNNIHFSKMMTHCSPCSINYDYIIKMETMTEDVNYIFSKIGIKNATLVSKNTSKKVDKEDRFRIFDSLSDPTLKRVFDHIHEDLLLFDYKLPDYLLRKLNLTVV